MWKFIEYMKKIFIIILFIIYKGVKFIDVFNKNVIVEYEIWNIFCVVQDLEDFCIFVYIIKDLQISYYYCYVFSIVDVNLIYEIILMLGQVFEVVYQLVLQVQKFRVMGVFVVEMIEIKFFKLVFKFWVGVRKFVLELFDMD